MGFAHPATGPQLCKVHLAKSSELCILKPFMNFSCLVPLATKAPPVLLLCLAVSVPSSQPLWCPTIPGRKVVEDIPTNHSPGGSVSKQNHPAIAFHRRVQGFVSGKFLSEETNLQLCLGHTPDLGVCTKLKV